MERGHMAKGNETVKEPHVKEPHLKEPHLKEPHLKEPQLSQYKSQADDSPRIADLKVKDLPGKPDATAKPKPRFPKMGLGVRG
jgi:hypothetical protein